MAQCLLLKTGGSGLDPDELTATSNDVLSGVKFGGSGADEPLVGTMPNHGAVSQSIGINGRYNIPAGYHNGSGAVTQSIANHGAVSHSLGVNGRYTIPAGYHNGSGAVTQSIANHGAVSQSLSINGSYTIPEGYHNGGGKITQSIPIQYADEGDRAHATGVSNWQGVVNLQVRNGHYLNGVNWIQGNIPNFRSENIKKGVNIGGVVGTWEGYVAEPTDVYYYGINNLAGSWWEQEHYSRVEYQSDQILFIGVFHQQYYPNPMLVTGNKIDLTRYSKVRLRFTDYMKYHSADIDSHRIILCVKETQDGYRQVGYNGVIASAILPVKDLITDNTYTLDIDVKNLSSSYYLGVHMFVPTGHVGTGQRMMGIRQIQLVP